MLAKDRFDDGGVSGGTLDRPSLARLMAEIEAGRVGMVVVYKIDRLTRSLANFAKLVECFEAAGCSFVSVTQAFNTASSMGRLTLNVLLSFAQFEREVTAERIRDKIAASKKQGMWMGRLPPLGYNPHPDPMVRELVVNAAEAETIRALFDLYDRHDSLAQVEREAARLGLRSKLRRFASGRLQGGGRLSRGHIHSILVNPVYLGRTRHKTQTFPGRHPAIIDEGLWARAQDKLRASSRRRRGRVSGNEPACLLGKLRDETGDRLTPTHSVKSGRRHRYYVSNRLISGGPDPTGWRLPGSKLEALVADVVAGHLLRATGNHQLVGMPDLRMDAAHSKRVRALAAGLRGPDAAETVQRLLVSGTISPREMCLTLNPAAMSVALDIPVGDLAPGLLDFAVPIALRRRGVEARLITGTPRPAPNPVLARALRDAHHWVGALRNGAPLSQVASDAGRHDVMIRTRGPLAFLAPKIQTAIRDGTLPPELTLKRILQQQIPLDWDAQARLYGE